MTEGVAASPESANGATTCGLCPPNGVCLCREGRAALTRWAQTAAVAGMRAADGGDWTAAGLLLWEAVAIDPSLTSAWEAGGLCAFASGQISEARYAWRAAVALNLDSRANDWLASLATGELQQVVDAYNRALQAAQNGRLVEALTALDESMQLCPDFLPSLRLEGLLRRANGRLDEAGGSWLEHARRWQSDSVIQSVLGSYLVGLPQRPARQPSMIRWLATAVLILIVGVSAWGLGARTRWPAAVPEVSHDLVSATTTTRTAEPRANLSPQKERALLSIALTGHPDSLVALIETVGLDTAGWSPEGLHKAMLLVSQAGRRQYLAARRSLANGLDSLAIRQLDRAVALAHGSYYADDALYSIVLTNERMGDTAAAKATATRLLSEYPTSIYANSRTRRIAGITPPMREQ